MTPKKKSFYVGIKQCGCITASMIDAAETTPQDIAAFAIEMHKSNRKVAHREYTLDEFRTICKRCTCAANPDETKA